jgi:hypothetical protein
MTSRGSGRDRVAPADAWYLFADKLKTDQFLVYGFAGTPVSVEQAVEEVIASARTCSELRLRVGYPDHLGSVRLRFPVWVPGDVDPGQIIVHESDPLDWPGFLRTIGWLIEGHQLDPERAMWRLHVFVGVHGVPGSPGQPATVAVVQISHALADGMRAAALAGILFGRREAPPPIDGLPIHWPFARSIEALRARRQLAADTEAGLVPDLPDPVPPLSINNKSTGAPILRTFVRHRAQLPGKSATKGALIAISEALSGYLRERGEDPSTLTALVPMAFSGTAHARNHSGPEFIRLHTDVPDRADRDRLIAAQLADSHSRRQHAALAANQLALANLPGPMLRWIQSRALPQIVMGHTVVSSVNRGPADLSFGGCPVIMTAGYPFLTPTMPLTHGIHGIGEMVGISVYTTTSVISDIEEYIDRVNFGLRPQL